MQPNALLQVDNSLDLLAQLVALQMGNSSITSLVITYVVVLLFFTLYPSLWGYLNPQCSLVISVASESPLMS
ncbi:hypothetical protein OG21DRAFT_548198 [Imleria badia]|nr:hypothetical protein OG21DRAFT_548198 [Imleria badia]